MAEGRRHLQYWPCHLPLCHCDSLPGNVCVYVKYFCDGIVSQKADAILWVFSTVTLFTLAIYTTMYLLRWWAPRYMYTL
jgi:hypothetical protein